MALSYFSDATVPLSQASQITGLALLLRTSSSLLDAALPCESLSLISSTVNSDLQQLSSKRAIVVTVPQHVLELPSFSRCTIQKISTKTDRVETDRPLLQDVL